MDFDLQRMLAPVSDDAPSGPDLSYDPDFIALEQAAQGKPEQQFGEAIIPGEEPDWQDVRRRCEALLSRTKDLRVAVLLARALTRVAHVEGLSSGLELIREMLSRYWDTLHPQLDHDDGDDPTMRLNALGSLADSTSFLRDIRNASLVSSQHGRVLVRDILVNAGKLPQTNGAALSEVEIEGVLRSVASENPEPLKAAVSSARIVVELESLLSNKGILSQAPDLRPLNDVLHSLVPPCNAALSAEAEAGAATPGVSATPATRSAGGAIQNRDDAIRALDNVCKFMEQAEPSNPAPLLIRRAQRLIGRSFVEIIGELAPESLGQIQKLGGLEQK
jgi:type VI secretion system protein ImpA